MGGGIFTQLGEGRGNSSSNGGQGSTLLSPVHIGKGSQIFNNTGNTLSTFMSNACRKQQQDPVGNT